MEATYSTETGIHYTVETLIRYAASQFAAIGLTYPAARMSKVIRRAFRTTGARHVRAVIDDFIEREEVKSWRTFELRTVTGHSDPTSAHAARAVDHSRSAL